MTACKAVSSKGICLITVTETILMRLRVGLLADSVLTWQLHQKFLSTLEGDTFRAGAGYHQLLTAVARNTRADSTIDNEANAYDGDGQLSLQQQHEYEAGSVASLLAGGERLPTDQLPGSKRRKVKGKRGLRPAFVRRVAGNHRKLGVHDLIRPVQTATEVALFAHLLPDFRRGKSADYWGMAIRFNNRLLQAYKMANH
ncbi:hypothetical protein ABBQ32_006569 [Trebouxia sp. C0010 RCD-2024]